MKKSKLAIDHAPSWVYSHREVNVYWIVQEDEVEREYTGVAAFFDLEAAKEYLKKVHKIKDDKIIILDFETEE